MTERRLAEIPIMQIWLAPDRQRKEMGNVEELMWDIKKLGLINPIFLTEEINPDNDQQLYKLVAGERRYIACRGLDYKTIRATVVEKGLTILQLEEIELSENLKRKDLDWWEEVEAKSRLYALRASQLKTKSFREVGESLNIPKSTLSEAVTMSKAVQVWPQLKDTSNYKEARTLYRKLVQGTILEKLADEGRYDPQEVEKRKVQKSVDSTPQTTQGGAIQIVNYPIYSAEHLAKVYAGFEDHFIVEDCFKLMKGIKNETFDILEVDPPWGVEKSTVTSREDADVAAYDDIKKKDYPAFLESLIPELIRVAKPHAWIIFWFGYDLGEQVFQLSPKVGDIETKFINGQNLLIDGFRNRGCAVDPIPCIWAKLNSARSTNQPATLLGRNYESFLMIRRGKPAIIKQHTNVFYQPTWSPSRRWHPTQKPMQLYYEILETIGVPGSTLFSPFAGSGTILMTATEMGIKAIGSDTSPRTKEMCLRAVIHRLSHKAKEGK